MNFCAMTCAPSAAPAFHGSTIIGSRHAGRAGTIRGAGESWRKPFNGRPADDRLRSRILYPDRFRPGSDGREIQASVSPTPFVVDPGVASGDCTAILRVANLHPTSPGLT